MNQYLRIEREWPRTIVVGDIHGCFDEFKELLDAVNFADDDLLIHVGDMIDRGPQSWGVAEFFRDTPNAHTAIGNHERRLAGSVHGTSLPAWSQLQTLSLIDQSEWDAWAENFASLPAVIESEHVIVTHARLDPTKSIQDQDPHFTCAVGGRGVVIECDENGVPLWFHQMTFDKPVCIGHIGYDRVELVPGKLYALDTGCAKGRQLAAVILPAGQVVLLDAKRNYYSEARQRWGQGDHVANRRINEWHMQLHIPKDDPCDWPIKKVVDLLQMEQPIENQVVAEAKRRLDLAITELGFAQTIQRAKEQLIRRFGEVPEVGPDRGDFYKRLRSSVPKRGIGSLAAKLLDGQCCSVEELAVALKKKGTLRQANQVLESLIHAVNE